MLRTMMKSKLHRAIVTEANLQYVGSITIDEDLLEMTDILPNEKVSVVNNNNGARFETYVIPGPRGKKEICINGAAARLTEPGDTVIIISYGVYSDVEAKKHIPKVAIMNAQNEVVEFIEQEPPSTIK